ncbi:MAG: class I SAM-dependent methyltransferase [Tepidisphaeraceae bacterium]|jgi:ubiquinone/menaquinone biosynthesis C-methylase UbiE
MNNPPRKPSSKSPGKEFVSTDWGDVADWYDQHVGESGGEYHQQVVIPGALRLLGAAPGEKMIDVACGQGVFCRVLQSRGIAVTGVDAAAELIRAARHRGPAEIQYLLADARDFANLLPAAQFDAAVCVLAIQNVHPLPPIFHNVARVLKSGGRLVIVMMHPCFRGAKETSWGWDESAKAQYRRIDRYLLPRKTPIATHPGSNPNQYTWTFHRPIGGYVKALRDAGFLIDAMEEWPSHKQSDSGPRAAAENAARQEIPMFLAIRAIKMRGEPGRRPDVQTQKASV